MRKSYVVYCASMSDLLTIESIVSCRTFCTVAAGSTTKSIIRHIVLIVWERVSAVVFDRLSTSVLLERVVLILSAYVLPGTNLRNSCSIMVLTHRKNRGNQIV